MTAMKTGPMNPANARWQARRRRLIGYGQWEPFVDAEPARAHLKKIMAAGMPIAVVCERLGLAQTSSLQHLMYGRGGYGPARQVRRETSELILGYWPSLDDFPEGSRIESLGTQRRVQALAVLGWPRHWMATRIGMSATHFKKALNRDRVTLRLARAVTVLYDELWNQNPLEYGLTAVAVGRVKADAARAGWSGPLAWDDDTIDDPKATPQTDAVKPAASDGPNIVDRWLMGESVILGLEDRRQVVQHLFEWTNDTPEQIAAQVEMSLDALWQTWTRLKKKARDEGRPEPWRRVYVPRERSLKQDDMEEVA
ncbi:hypothetical protein [Streptomyces sp. NPDC005548]|uniref:hypothetical protein n=1 Tax=Streptomyces sp. NPDC005548 TaxID=3364724 RepID=UPI00369FE347